MVGSKRPGGARSRQVWSTRHGLANPVLRTGSKFKANPGLAWASVTHRGVGAMAWRSEGLRCGDT
jgi:hypothetical protein